jgi:hypothetical protein
VVAFILTARSSACQILVAVKLLSLHAFGTAGR